MHIFLLTSVRFLLYNHNKNFLGPRFQINTISAYIDGNFVYGSDQDVASRLRGFHGGKFSKTSVFHVL